MSRKSTGNERPKPVSSGGVSCPYASGRFRAAHSMQTPAHDALTRLICPSKPFPSWRSSRNPASILWLAVERKRLPHFNLVSRSSYVGRTGWRNLQVFECFEFGTVTRKSFGCCGWKENLQARCSTSGRGHLSTNHERVAGRQGPSRVALPCPTALPGHFEGVVVGGLR